MRIPTRVLADLLGSHLRSELRRRTHSRGQCRSVPENGCALSEIRARRRQRKRRAAGRNRCGCNGRQGRRKHTIEAAATAPEDGENQEQQKNMKTRPRHRGSQAFLQ